MILENTTFLIIVSIFFIIFASFVYSLLVYFFIRFIYRSIIFKKHYKFQSVKTSNEELDTFEENELQQIGKNDQLLFGEVKSLDSKVIFQTLNEINNECIQHNDMKDSDFYLLNKSENNLNSSNKFRLLGMKSKSFSDFGAIKNQNKRISGLNRKSSRSEKSLVFIINKSNLIFTNDKTAEKQNYFQEIELEY